MARVLLVRHGQTDANLEPIRVQGRLDVPLNQTGRRQAVELADRVAGLGLRALYSSDLSRARETAAAVAERTGLEVIVDPRLAEGWRGRWEGHLFADIATQEPEAYAAWRRADEGFRFPEGESLAEHRARTSAVLADVREGPLPALVVTHGGTIRLALIEARGLDLSAFHGFEVPNAEPIALG